MGVIGNDSPPPVLCRALSSNFRFSVRFSTFSCSIRSWRSRVLGSIDKWEEEKVVLREKSPIGAVGVMRRKHLIHQGVLSTVTGPRITVFRLERNKWVEMTKNGLHADEND